MIGYKLPDTVLSRLSILKQQELDIKEVIATIFEKIKQRRADLRFCLPELREVLIGLLQDHSIDTRDLERTMGESHPVTILCGQREGQLIDAANDAIHMAGNIVRDEEDWFKYTLSYDDEAEAGNTANAEASTDQATASRQHIRQTITEVNNVSMMREANTVFKETTRQAMMDVCIVSEQITRPSTIGADNVAAEDLSLQAEQAPSEDTLQVRVNMHQTLDTAHCLPLGPASEAQSTAGIRQLLPPSLPLDTRLPIIEGKNMAEENLSLLVVQAVTRNNLQVKELSHTTKDTAVNLPLECENAVASRQPAQSMRKEFSVTEADHNQPRVEAVTMDAANTNSMPCVQAEKAMSKDTLQVKYKMYQTLDTAVSLPLGPAIAAQPTSEIKPQLLPRLSLQYEGRGELGHREDDHQPEEEEVKGGCSIAEKHQGTHLVHSELLQHQTLQSHDGSLKIVPLQSTQHCATQSTQHCATQSTQHCATQSILNHTTIDVFSQQTSKPSQILDRCLAQASVASKKLDRLSASQASGRTEKTVLARDPPINQGLLNPRAQLDNILARASQLLGKLDEVAARVSGTIKSDQQRGQDSSRQISDKETTSMATAEAAAWQPRMGAVSTMADNVKNTPAPSACQLKLVAVSTTEAKANLKVKVEKNQPLDTAVHPPLGTLEAARVSGTTESDLPGGQVSSQLISSLTASTLEVVTAADPPAKFAGSSDRQTAQLAGKDQQRGQDSSRQISDKEAPIMAMAEAAAWQSRMVAVSTTAAPSVCQSKVVAVSTMADDVKHTPAPPACQHKLVPISTMAEVAAGQSKLVAGSAMADDVKHTPAPSACQHKLVAVSTMAEVAASQSKLVAVSTMADHTAVTTESATQPTVIHKNEGQSIQATLTKPINISAVFSSSESTLSAPQPSTWFSQSTSTILCEDETTDTTRHPHEQCEDQYKQTGSSSPCKELWEDQYENVGSSSYCEELCGDQCKQASTSSPQEELWEGQNKYAGSSSSCKKLWGDRYKHAGSISGEDQHAVFKYQGQSRQVPLTKPIDTSTDFASTQSTIISTQPNHMFSPCSVSMNKADVFSNGKAASDRLSVTSFQLSPSSPGQQEHSLQVVRNVEDVSIQQAYTVPVMDDEEGSRQQRQVQASLTTPVPQYTVHDAPLSKMGNQDYLQPEESGVNNQNKHPSTNLSHGMLPWPVNVQSRKSTQVEEGEEQHRHKKDDFQPAEKDVIELRGQNDEKQQDAHLLQPDSSQRRQPSPSTPCALKEQPACTQRQFWERADGREAEVSYGSDDKGKVHLDNYLESHRNGVENCEETNDNLTWSTDHCCTMLVLLYCCFRVNIILIQSTNVPHSHLGDQEPHREVRTGRQAHHHQCPPLHRQVGGDTAFPPSRLVNSPSTALVEASVVFSVSLSTFNQSLEAAAACQGCTGSQQIQWPGQGDKNAPQVGDEHLPSICHQLEPQLGVGEKGPTHQTQSQHVEGHEEKDLSHKKQSIPVVGDGPDVPTQQEHLSKSSVQDLRQPAEKGDNMKVSKPGEHQGTNLVNDELLQQRGGEEQGSRKQAAQVRRSSNKRKTVACRHAGLDDGRVAVSAIVPDKRNKAFKSKICIRYLPNGRRSTSSQLSPEETSRQPQVLE
jgi:hypothetical protein